MAWWISLLLLSKAITSSVLSQLFFQSNAAMLSSSKLIHQAITPVPMGSV